MDAILVSDAWPRWMAANRRPGGRAGVPQADTFPGGVP